MCFIKRVSLAAGQTDTCKESKLALITCPECTARNDTAGPPDGLTDGHGQERHKLLGRGLVARHRAGVCEMEFRWASV